MRGNPRVPKLSPPETHPALALVLQTALTHSCAHVPLYWQVSVRPRGNKPSRVSTVPVEKQALAKMDLMQSYSDYLQAVAGALAGRATEEVRPTGTTCLKALPRSRF